MNVKMLPLTHESEIYGSGESENKNNVFMG